MIIFKMLFMYLGAEAHNQRKRVLLVILEQILETQKGLFFHLHQQRLIELIRQGKTEEALDFATDHLAAQGEENPEFLAELGRWELGF